MLKLLTKKQFFVFSISLVATVFVGFILWGVFFYGDEIIKNVAGYINNSFFTASLYQEIDNKTSEILEGQVLVEGHQEQKINTVVVQNRSSVLTLSEMQDVLDNIKEKLDVIQQEADELLPKDQKSDLSESKTNYDKVLTPEIQELNGDIVQADNAISQDDNIYTGSSSKADYPKILISEVQIASVDDSKQEFIELYNPNDDDVDLTNWYLQRKTATSQSWSSYVSKTLFEGKFIRANDYFLVARTGYYINMADIFTDSSITDDNSFALKNPNGEISDKLGFGSAQDPEIISATNPSASSGQSVGRMVLENGEEQETNNNSMDFEIQMPTPRAQNKTYVIESEPEPLPTPDPESEPESEVTVLKNVLINEIQISSQDNANDEFLELYNPNDQDIDLTDWYIQKKTATGSSWSSYATKTLFYGKTIIANNYFLITKSGSSFEPEADILTSYSITDNNSFVLKDLNKDIVDLVGFGSAQEFETMATVSPADGQSIQRKWDFSANEPKDTNSNFDDFEASSSTPKAQNNVFVNFSEDITAPLVNFNLDLIQTTTAFSINFIITDPLVGTVTPSGVSGYILRQKEEGGDWQEYTEEFVSPSQNVYTGSKDFVAENGKTYYFQVKSEDLAGNISNWLLDTPAVTTVSCQY